MSSVDQVLSVLERHSDQTLEELIEFARIPSVSADGFDPHQVERSAEHSAQLLGKAGLEGVEVLRLPGAHPYVVGEWLRAGAEAAHRAASKMERRSDSDTGCWEKPYGLQRSATRS